MSDKTIVFIRARTRSSRLYGKVLQPLAGKPVIVHVGERAGMLRDVIDHAVFCIPDSPADDELAAVLDEHFGGDDFYHVIRGSEHNPLKRARRAVGEMDADIIIEGLNGDAPLAYMGFVREALGLLRNRPDLDCVRYWNPDCEWTMEHYACHAWPMRRSWWKKTITLADPAQRCYREHPTLFFHWHPDRFNIGYLEHRQLFDLRLDDNGRAWSTRYDLDWPEDLVFLGAIYDALYDGEPIPLADAVAHVNAHPHLRTLNASRAESVGVYASSMQKRKWARSHTEWRTPRGCEKVYCASGECYLGYLRSDSPHLVTAGGSVWKAGSIECECGAGREWSYGG
jgi:spore coat polysaccharide biosynthesis protein SpsF (cytidylyltransferase family)